MTKVLVLYYTRSGNTKKMAEIISETIGEEGLDVELKQVEDAAPEDLLEADGIVMGSPTYYGTMATEVKRLLDDSVKFHGKLDGKAGAAFASAAVSGQETTIFSILQAMLIHGMIVQGDPQGCHYGAVSMGEPEAHEEEVCRRFGVRFAGLVKSLA